MERAANGLRSSRRTERCAARAELRQVARAAVEARAPALFRSLSATDRPAHRLPRRLVRRGELRNPGLEMDVEAKRGDALADSGPGHAGPFALRSAGWSRRA